MYYKGQYKCREPSCGYITRELLNKNRCMVIGCKGRVSVAHPHPNEAQTNDTLRYLQGLFNVTKYKNELAVNKKDGSSKLDAVPHEEMLKEVM